MKTPFCLLALLFVSLNAKEIVSVSVNGDKVLKVNQYGMGQLWQSLSADLDIKAQETSILQGSAYAYVAANQYFGAGASFQIGVDGFRLKCNELSFKGHISNSGLEGSVTTDCFLDIGTFYSNYYERLDFALSKEELELRYVQDFGIKIEDITFVQITEKVGCQFRSGPSYNAAPIARIGYSAEIAFLGDDRDHRGWLKVLISTKEKGWIEAFVGKRLTNMSGDTDYPEIREKGDIPPLVKLFEE